MWNEQSTNDQASSTGLALLAKAGVFLFYASLATNGACVHCLGHRRQQQQVMTQHPCHLSVVGQLPMVHKQYTRPESLKGG
jgi:hypothetical protein